MTSAVYDLSRYPANFNFQEFLVCASTLGATHVHLDDSKGYRKKYSPEETAKRMRSIVEPSCALAGCTYSYGRGKGIDPGYHISAVLKTYKQAGTLKRFTSPLGRGTERFTVTLRHSTRYPERNSNQEAWRRFAKEIGAYVIEDFDDKPIHLHERMRLYSGAEMNFCVANGPGVTLYFSECPFLYFMSGVDMDYLNRHGFPKGSQLPWANERQRIVWAEDTYDNIRRAFECLSL